MEVPNAAETNGATTTITTSSSSFLQHLHIVSGLFKLRDAATSVARGLWGAAFGIQKNEAAAVVEDDLEAGPPEETNVQTIFRTTFIEQFETPSVKKLMPKFPATFLYFTLPALLCLAQIKWQLSPLGFPSSALHKWYIVCVTSLLMEFVASIAQSIISAAAGGGESIYSVYNIIALLGRISCYLLFLVSLAVLLYS